MKISLTGLKNCQDTKLFQWQWPKLKVKIRFDKISISAHLYFESDHNDRYVCTVRVQTIYLFPHINASLA